jgi:hypothetical protein
MGVTMAMDAQAQVERLQGIVVAQHTALSASLLTVPSAVVDLVLRDLHVEGHAITTRDLDAMRDSLSAQLLTIEQRLMGSATSAAVPTVPTPEATAALEGYQPFQWADGTRHWVPEGWTVVPSSALHAWYMFTVGDAQQGIVPYSALSTSDLPYKARSSFSRLVKVCLYIFTLARALDEEEEVESELLTITSINTIGEARAVYMRVKSVMCTQLCIQEEQLPNVKVNTLYNKLIALRPEGIFLQSRKRRRIGGRGM